MILLLSETENWEPGAQKVAHHFSAHFCLVKTPSIAIWGQQIKLFMKTQFFKIHYVTSA
jgi:hypothetical protein